MLDKLAEFRRELKRRPASDFEHARISEVWRPKKGRTRGRGYELFINLFESCSLCEGRRYCKCAEKYTDK